MLKKLLYTQNTKTKYFIFKYVFKVWKLYQTNIKQHYINNPMYIH